MTGKIIATIIVLLLVTAGLMYLHEPDLLKPSHWRKKKAQGETKPSNWAIIPEGRKLVYEFEYETTDYKMPEVTQENMGRLVQRLAGFASYPPNPYANGMKVEGIAVVRPWRDLPRVVIEGTVQPRCDRRGVQLQAFAFTTSLEYSELFGPSYHGPKPYVVDVGAQIPCGLDMDLIGIMLVPRLLPAEGDTVPGAFHGSSSSGPSFDGELKFIGMGTDSEMGRKCRVFGLDHRITGRNMTAGGSDATFIDVDGVALLSENDGILITLKCNSCRAVTERWPGSGLGVLLQYEYNLKAKLKSDEKFSSTGR